MEFVPFLRAGEIKILIVQHAVITEQTSSPRLFSHFSPPSLSSPSSHPSFRRFEIYDAILSFILFLGHASFLFFSLLSSVLLSCESYAEVVEVCTASSELYDWTSFQGSEGSFACWNRRERSFSWMELWDNICRLRAAELIRRLRE